MTVQEQSRSRLTPIEEINIYPFVRAVGIQDASIYWIRVRGYPLHRQQRDWLIEFHRRLAAHLCTASSLREECFLRFKSLDAELNSRFTACAREYVPIMGASLVPGTTPKPLYDADAVKKAVDAFGKNGTSSDAAEWMQDYLYWFLCKKPDAIRKEFYGCGGMLTLYLAKDPKSAPPALNLPRVLKTHPAFSDKAEQSLAMSCSLQDAFLAKSKAAFGEPFRDDPSYEGMMFVLPLFTADALTRPTPDQRKIWFSIFDGYIIESKVDHGVLLAMKQPFFDEALTQLLKQMKEDGHVYRT
jgi:hypothetical protein